MKNRIKTLALMIVLLSVLLVGLPDAVLAQADGSKEFQVQAGPYGITVIADPSRHSLGTVLYTIAVVNLENAQPVTPARVTIYAWKDGEDTVGSALAVNRRPSDPGTYEATVQLDIDSIWHTSVEVNSSLGRVEVEVPVPTIPQPRPTRSGSLVFLGVFAVILLGAAYLVWSSRKAIKAREAASEN